MPGGNALTSHNAPMAVAGMNMQLVMTTDAGEDGGVKDLKPRGKDKKTRAPRKCKRCVKSGGATPSQCIGASTSKKKNGECDFSHASGEAK